jgi:hypothetical protein
MLNHEGGCICGGLRYVAKREPARVTYCHCRFCQKATGSAYLVEPVFAAGDIELMGETPRYRHISTGSGKWVDIHFCATCGTKIMLTFERFPDAVGVYGGTFDDPNWFERKPSATKHIFLSAAQRGTVIPAGLNCFEEHAMTNSGTPIEARQYAVPYVID